MGCLALILAAASVAFAVMCPWLWIAYAVIIISVICVTWNS